jgi:tetratricopeptide (TPR) repeat protein
LCREALQAYSEGKKVQTQKGREALPFLNHAVELDPNFAVAYVALGDCYSNIGQTTQGMENLKRAFELRERVSEREKFLISSHYYVGVTGELEKANQQFELWVHDYPRDGEAHGNLGVNYSALGQYDKAVAEDEEAFRLDPNNLRDSGIGWNALKKAYQGQRRKAAQSAKLFIFPIQTDCFSAWFGYRHVH